MEILIAFGTWRCNCTMLTSQLENIPDLCPDHGVALLLPRGMEPHLTNRPMDLASGKSASYG